MACCLRHPGCGSRTAGDGWRKRGATGLLSPTPSSRRCATLPCGSAGGTPCPLKGIFVGPDCVETHLIFEEWGEVVSRYVESRPGTYSPPEYGTKWGACPISLTVSDFSHSLGRTVSLCHCVTNLGVLSGEDDRCRTNPLHFVISQIPSPGLPGALRLWRVP